MATPYNADNLKTKIVSFFTNNENSTITILRKTAKDVFNMYIFARYAGNNLYNMIYYLKVDGES